MEVLLEGSDLLVLGLLLRPLRLRLGNPGSRQLGGGHDGDRRVCCLVLGTSLHGQVSEDRDEG